MPSQCQAAAVKAYREMKRCGRRDDHAYEVAVQVLQHFHPELQRLEAFELVDEWLEEDDRLSPVQVESEQPGR